MPPFPAPSLQIINRLEDGKKVSWLEDLGGASFGALVVSSGDEQNGLAFPVRLKEQLRHEPEAYTPNLGASEPSGAMHLQSIEVWHSDREE